MAELTDAQKVLRNDTGKRIAAAIEALGGTPQIDLGMTGASVGQVPVINTVDANGAPTSYRPGSGGGGGGTSDYNDLSSKPSINDVTLSGNKTAAELGLGTYSKPNGGIPKSDLASAVQTSLGKADSALQSVPSTYRTATAQDAIDAAQDSNLATIESSPATAAHAVGEYIVYNGQLYKVTAAIAAGQTLTPGTNIEAVALADAVKLLNDKDKTYRVATGISGVNVFLKGNLALLSVTGFQFTASSRGWYKVTTLPTSVHPTSFTVFTGFDNLADNVLLECRVDTNGSFYVYAWAATTYELRCNACYFTSEDGTI